MSNGVELGNSYFELCDDKVIVHVITKVGGVLVGEQTYPISYIEFNEILNSELPQKAVEQDDWSMLNRYFTTRDGQPVYMFPVGTYEVELKDDGVHVKQKVGASGWNIIDCTLNDEVFKADWGSIYSVEWCLSGNIHTMRGNSIVQVVNVQRLVSGIMGTSTAVLVDVPFLKEKLVRDVHGLWRSSNRMSDRKRWWVEGADPLLRKITEQDISIRRFRVEVLRSQQEQNAINWEVFE